MKRKRFTEEQIIAILREYEGGAKCADLCRKHGMSEAAKAGRRPGTDFFGSRAPPFELGDLLAQRVDLKTLLLPLPMAEKGLLRIRSELSKLFARHILVEIKVVGSLGR